MKVEQRVWTHDGGWREQVDSGGALSDANLVLLFGGTDALASKDWLDGVRSAYPNAALWGCSTAGEICGTRVHDDSVVATAVFFEKTRFHLEHVDLDIVDGDSWRAGATLAKALEHDGLRHVLTLSDGQEVNGSELVRGLTNVLPDGVQVTGGLAGDGDRFEKTLLVTDGEVRQNAVSVMGLYGDGLQVGYGSLGGWDPFGPIRLVTRSEGNILYELDDKPALALYKKYLGAHASGLPSTGLLFPLQVDESDDAEPLVRTILSVDEERQSLTFAGDVPEGALAQLMKANFDRLIEGAEGAAKSAMQDPVDLAILISCVGRKLVLKQRTEEEVESVRSVVGPSATLAGFYSYGEICPVAREASCQLHNQTMTITTLTER